MGWVACALFSALFAGITALLAKLGVEGIPSNLATLIRTGVVLVFAAGIVSFRGELPGIREIGPRSWLFLVLSGLATGLSWLFYFAALKMGPISRVAPIDKLSFVIAVVLGVVVLREKVNGITAAAIVLIVAGVLLTLPEVQQTVGHWFSGRSGPRSG
ncbi:MAG: EamA family transporter [Capsulimonadaceae bacterium]|nr:EamA family transporter [Capsulimonadaceae bacterium]